MKLESNQSVHVVHNTEIEFLRDRHPEQLPTGGTPGSWMSGTFHLIESVQIANAAVAYLVEFDPESVVSKRDGYFVARRIRILRELTIEELASEGIFYEGEHHVSRGVQAYGSSVVHFTAPDSAMRIFHVRDDATVHIIGAARVFASGNARVFVNGNGAVIECSDNSSVNVSGSTRVHAFGSATVEARGDSIIDATNGTTIIAHGDCIVRAYGGINQMTRGFSDNNGGATIRLDERAVCIIMGGRETDAMKTDDAVIIDRRV